MSFIDYFVDFSYINQNYFIIIIALLCILSYLLGSLNLGVILSRKLGKEDIRNFGSGNAGSTNMMRTYGKKMGIITILGDMAKVAIAILIAFLVLFSRNGFTLLFGSHYMDNQVILLKSLIGIFCVIGHIFPCYFNFKGGKGVATCGGMVFMIDWRIALILLVFFFITILISKMVSLGSMVMAVLYPVFMYILHQDILLLIVSIVFTTIVIIAHRKNIVKIINHTESKITDKKSDK